MSKFSIISAPIKSLQGDINIPGDKSISHRAIMLGSIAKGTTIIEGFLDSEDCMATLHAFRMLGVSIEEPVHQKVVIHGVGKYGLKKPSLPLNCGNSGTTMRLLSGILAAQKFTTHLTGDLSLLKRPMERIARPLLQMGADIVTNNGTPPLIINGTSSNSLCDNSQGTPLKGIKYDMPEASAQVKSCVLLAGMYALGETTVIDRQLTRDHTELMLKTFSYPINVSDKSITINSNAECQGTSVRVPGDISSAAFFIVAATLVPNSELYIRNIGINPKRTGIINILKLMGASIDVINHKLWGEEPVADLLVRSAKLNGIEIPAELVPSAIDEFPIIFIAASCAKGQTTLHSAKELRYKESDRILVMVKGLNALGIESYATLDGIIIKGGILKGGEVDSAKDHRVAMSFAIAGLVAQDPVVINDTESILTSFPSFIDKTKQLQMGMREVLL